MVYPRAFVIEPPRRGGIAPMPATTAAGAARPGAALAVVLLLVVILNCVLIGTLHLAAQERLISTNTARLLQLRLDAEGAARKASRPWSEALDTLGIGAAERLLIAGQPARVEVERIAEYLFLIRAEAREPPPRHGRATAALLIVPPALRPAAPPGPAAVSSGSGIRILATGVITAAAHATCATPAAFSMATSAHAAAVIDPGGQVDAPAGSLPSRPLHDTFPRIRALAPLLVHSQDSTLALSTRGVLLIDGNLTLAAGVTFDGLVLASGDVHIAAGAVVRGAVHAAQSVTVAGAVQFDPCTVRAEVAAAGLDRARATATRWWVPSF